MRISFLELVGGRVGGIARTERRLSGALWRPPVVLDLCSTSSRRWAWRRSCVPSSSAPISREYPATSAARIAASLWVEVMAGQAPWVEESALTIAQTAQRDTPPDEAAVAARETGADPTPSGINHSLTGRCYVSPVKHHVDNRAFARAGETTPWTVFRPGFGGSSWRLLGSAPCWFSCLPAPSGGYSCGASCGSACKGKPQSVPIGRVERQRPPGDW